MKENEYMKKVMEDNLADKERIRNKALNSSYIEKTSKFSFKKIVAIAACLIIVFAGTFAALASIYYAPDSDDINSTASKSYDDIIAVIEAFHDKESSFNVDDYNLITKNYDSVEEDSAGTAINDYTTTNVQTEGVDEGDIVKNDSEYIYKLSTSGFYIIAVDNGQMTLQSTVAIENYVPQEMYISGNTIVLLGGVYEQYYYSGYGSATPLMDCMCYLRYTKTDIRVYDISDKTSPVLTRQITVDGSYNSSRLLVAENKLVYMVNYYFYYGTEENYIPQLSDSTLNGGAESQIPAENIYYYDDVVNYSYLIMGSIDLDEPATGSTLGAYLGLGGTIYVSSDNIYVATYDAYSTYEVNILGWVKEDEIAVAQTRIVKISLSDLKQVAVNKINGSVKDRYSMDEYNGYLRVATTAYASDSYSNVYVLDAELDICGMITDIAPGETIYSVKFSGDTGSLVTFEQVDPYYNLDLSDPNNPQISAGLKEDGVSYYIHYLGDTKYTIGVGKMSETITDNYGTRVIWTGLKVSLYDNTSGEAVNICTVMIEGSCYSELFYNAKALCYNEDRGLFAFTYENWQYNSYNYYYTSMEQGLAVFQINLNAENDSDKLVYRDTLTNLNSDVELNSYYYDYYDSYLTFINRGIQIGDYIYTVSDKYVKSYNITTLTQVISLKLYE